MFQLAARFVTNQSVYIALCSRNHSLMVVTFSTRTITFKSKIGNYRKSFLTSFTLLSGWVSSKRSAQNQACFLFPNPLVRTSAIIRSVCKYFNSSSPLSTSSLMKFKCKVFCFSIVSGLLAEHKACLVVNA